MENVDSVDLESLVEVAGPQDLGRVVRLLVSMCDLLGEQHGVGRIVRDLRPSRIRLCVRGERYDVVELVDGARADERSESSMSSSATRPIAGTPLYMSPEAILEPSRVDVTSDLYALGAVGYFLLTGQPPFVGKTLLDVCSSHLQSPVQPPSAKLGRILPRELEDVVLRCLAKEPEHRPASARELAAKLLACREVTPWSDERARGWWEAYGPALAAHKRRATHDVSSRRAAGMTDSDARGSARPVRVIR